MKQKQLTLQKFIDQVQAGSNNSLNERVSTMASLIIALSGLILYSDKALAFFDIAIIMPDKFAEKGVSTEIFVWLVAQTLSPLLIIIGSILRPYFYAYTIPIYCYVLQFYFVLIDYSLVDDGYSYAYSLGITALLVLIMYFARTASQRSTKMMIEQSKEKIRKSKVEHAAD
ncbi:hypothetical protein [Maribacter sp. ACAM166]|uniref:hypothetical protein n=1 Tax=Maribacter sp. ACAM166 TaxID=2508996 RepID=UPI0010FF55E0|nr:hypothetical protein [Maribacter sp. ACAM166]TLP81837.1 hypothetical protein ES765_03925 [Maribacter sp. ACAM166]